jgi:hypothetical protein
VVQHLTAATLDQGNHDRNSWISTLMQHHWTKKIIIETLGFYNDFLGPVMLH